MEEATQTVESFSTEIPNPARIYDYSIGGSHWFPADKTAADHLISLVPSTPKWVRMLRDFLQQAARELWDEGLTHFVDFASGLPTDDHLHAVLPERARIVYSDVDPYTIAKAQELVGHLPNVLYLRHDVREARALLESPEVEEFLGGEREVALGASGITVFLSPGEIRRLFQDLYDWAAPGSRLYTTFETNDPGRTTPRLEQFLEAFRQTGAPYWLYSPEEAVELTAPWSLPEEGLVPLCEYLGLPEGHVTEADREGVGLEFYAAILEKPLEG